MNSVEGLSERLEKINLTEESRRPAFYQDGYDSIFKGKVYDGENSYDEIHNIGA
jgi:hypothetical protein